MRVNTVKNIIVQTLIVAIFLTISAVDAAAQIFDEGSDASAELLSAKVVPAGTTQITGDLTNTVTNEDIDVYVIEIPSDGVFTIEAKAVVVNDPDMNLIVFNSSRQGLAGDDDNDSSCSVLTSLNSFDSCLTLNLTAGTYFIAVGVNNIGAFESVADYEAGTNDFIDNDFGILSSPTTEIAVIVGEEDGPTPAQDEGDYVINFSEALTTATTTTTLPAATTTTTTATTTTTIPPAMLRLKKTWSGAFLDDSISASTSGLSINAVLLSTSTGDNMTTGTAVQVLVGEMPTLNAEVFTKGSAGDYVTSSWKCDGADSTVAPGTKLSVLLADAGNMITCTVTNTGELFEGIPVLNRYGLALLALLMLGIGVIGFRRFI